MAEDDDTTISLTRGGFINRLYARLDLKHPLVLALLLAGIGWLPSAVLTLVSAAAGDRSSLVLFFADLTTYARSWCAVPLMVLAEWVVDLHVSDAGKRLRELVDPAALPRLNALERTATRRANAPAAEVAVLVLSCIPVALRFVGVIGVGGDSWYLVNTHDFPTSAAGWWYSLVGVPLVLFLLLRWVWRYLWWVWFLVRASRLPLHLTPSHPDGAAGLGFLARVQGSFYPVVAAVTVVIAAQWAESLAKGRTHLESYAAPFLLLTFNVLVIFILPTLAFVWQLAILRVEGHRPFDSLVWRYHRDFENEWVHPHPKKSPLGTPDIQSLNDLNGAFETSHTMRIRLIGLRAETGRPLAAALLIPMLLPIAAAFPVAEISKKLIEALI